MCRLAEEFAYLAVLLDAFSRLVIGWAIASPLAHGIQPSMSRIGCPYDNAMA
jgi:putative transposase